jgi:hypothetical protein
MATRDLYFLPILARALEPPRTHDTLQAAFDEIMRVGRQPDHARGFTQFVRFMAVIANARDRADQLARLSEYDRVTEAAFSEPSADAEERRIRLELLQSANAWRAYEALRAEVASAESREIGPGIRLTREQQVVGDAVFDDTHARVSVGGIVPGHYELVLDTGRLLWEAELAARDCQWAAAYPGEPLRLAAETAGVPQNARREIPLLESELILRVYPGIEAGRLELEWRRPRPPQHTEV